jgi:hypothetical protein
MKKRFLLTGCLTLLLGIGLTTYLYLPQESDGVLKASKFQTPEELMAAHVQRKIERREHGYAKPDKPDKFVEMLNLLKTGGDPSLMYPDNYKINEFRGAMARLSRLKSTATALPWIERGPGNVAGRTRCLVVDPDDASGNTWFAGAVGGGIWKTINAGTTWIELTTASPNLSISCMTMAPSNSNVIYAGTGEGFFNLDAIRGDGIYKSTDKGVSWQLLSSTKANSRFHYVNRIIVDPVNDNIVLAATNTGIYKSVDGGTTWTEKYNTEARVQQILHAPDNFNIQFATVNKKGIIKSINGGETWVSCWNNTEGRIEMAASSSDPRSLVAVTTNSDVYVSRDQGDNWAAATPDTKVQFLSGQGWYNNTLAFSLANSSNFIVGGLDVYDVTIGSDLSVKGDSVVTAIDGTSAKLTYVDFGGSALGGGLKFNAAQKGMLKKVELRFGAGKKQKAHRFTVGQASSVNLDPTQYTYVDYVEVPFEVWDVELGRQLMVSFRDQSENGVYDLATTGRELIFVHSNNYAETANSDIAKQGGNFVNNWYTIFPVLKQGVSWEPASWTAMNLRIECYVLKPKALSSSKRTVWSASLDKLNYAHADHHYLHIDAKGTPFRVIDCSDGGIAVSKDGGISWSSPNTGYNTSQFYGSAKHPTKNIYFGGMQDNGTSLSTENPGHLSQWRPVVGGDGFDVVWHQKNPQLMMTSIYYNGLYRSSNGGETWYKSNSGIGDVADNNSPFVTKIASSPLNPDLLMVAGKTGIWRSNDFGTTWKSVPISVSRWAELYSSAQIAISEADPKIVWAGAAMNSSIPVLLSTDAGNTFNAVNPSSKGSGYVSRIVPHPTDPNTVFALFSYAAKSKILKSSDRGLTWTDISGFDGGGAGSTGFPDVAVYSLVVMPDNDQEIWAGTEIGLFITTNGGLTWQYANNGLPAVCLWDLEIAGNQILATTHGRGIWTVELERLAQRVKNPYLKTASLLPTNQLFVQVDLNESFTSVEVVVNSQVKKIVDNPQIGLHEFRLEGDYSGKTLDVQVVGIKESKPYWSNFSRIQAASYLSPVNKYMNSFESNMLDFEGTGFGVKSLTGFDGYSIHTEHPYAKSTDYVYTLKYPIVVSEERANAIMKYSDIAFVEEGEPGALYGSEDFYDYVVVEGSKDGVNWKPLKDGYDYRYSNKWKGGTYLIDRQPSPNEFVQHVINLHDTFEPNDVILIRFRLHSDPEAVGWGWVIDNVKIQAESTGILDVKQPDNRLLKVTPNPVVDVANLSLDVPDLGEALIEVFDLSGRLIHQEKVFKTGNLLTHSINLGMESRGIKLVKVTVGGNSYLAKIALK